MSGHTKPDNIRVRNVEIDPATAGVIPPSVHTLSCGRYGALVIGRYPQNGDGSTQCCPGFCPQTRRRSQQSTPHNDGGDGGCCPVAISPLACHCNTGVGNNEPNRCFQCCCMCSSYRLGRIAALIGGVLPAGLGVLSTVRFGGMAANQRFAGSSNAPQFNVLGASYYMFWFATLLCLIGGVMLLPPFFDCSKERFDHSQSIGLIMSKVRVRGEPTLQTRLTSSYGAAPVSYPDSPAGNDSGGEDGSDIIVGNNHLAFQRTYAHSPRHTDTSRFSMRLV